MADGTNARKLRLVETAKFPIDDLDKREFGRVVTEALKGEFPNGEARAKTIADKADCTPAAVDNWFQHEHAPGSYTLIRLAAHYPRLKAEIMRLWAMEASLDPAAERALNDFIIAMTRSK